MPTEQAETLNLGWLGKRGLALELADYVRVVAAMGVTGVLQNPALGPDESEVPWTLGTFRRARTWAGRQGLPAAAPKFIAAWKRLIDESGVARVSIPHVHMWSQRRDPIDLLDILAHPATGLAARWIDWHSREADLKWRWPIRVSAFDDDFGQLELAALADEYWPANGLATPQVISREEARAEVLVLRADLRASLARILALKHRVRAGLVMLISPRDIRWSNIGPYLDTLLAETQAGGVAIVQPDPATKFVELFNQWVEHLSHNEPMDVATCLTFGTDRTTLMLDRRLLQETDFNYAFKVAALQLKELSHGTFVLPGATPARIDFSWKVGEPASALAREMVERADARDIDFRAESGGASALSEIETATRRAEREAATGERPRFLQGDVFRWVDAKPVAENRGFVVDALHALDVFISAEAEGQLRADQQVALEDIDWGPQEEVSLQVILAEPNQWSQPLRGLLRLPRHGRSSTHRFEFTPTRPGAFQGRVTLYYRGRILQTALLESRVVTSAAELGKRSVDAPGIALRVEAELRRSFATLNERRRFDACIVCNHTVTRQAAITAAGQDGAFISSLDKLATPIANINSLLTQVAQDADRYRKGLTSKANAELLGRLALEGNALYRHIVLDYIDRSTAATAIRDADYLQIVTMDPDSIVPLEFVYDYPAPRQDAPVCKHAKEALENGRCPSRCRPKQGPAAHVCPLGFWGLRKVIERHIHVPELDKAAKVLASEPITGRDELSLAGHTLVALSQEVASPGDAELLDALKRIRQPKVTHVKTWKAWAKAIARDKPVMLVVLPHADGVQPQITLEISGDTARSIDIDPSYVHVPSTPPPLTVLLGCDTANTADTSAYLSHVGVFRQADAALVLGTIATVLGQHAADMAGRLIERMEVAIRSEPGRFGEALLKAKRDAVASSEMIGLCLVAFGDADWKILPA